MRLSSLKEWNASIYLSKCFVSFWPFVYSFYQCHSHSRGVLFVKGNFSLLCLLLLLTRSFYPFKKGLRYFLCLSLSPFISDKDVTLICFMDIKFHPVQELATNFYFSCFQLLKTFFSRDTSGSSWNFADLKTFELCFCFFAKRAINKLFVKVNNEKYFQFISLLDSSFKDEFARKKCVMFFIKWFLP